MKINNLEIIETEEKQNKRKYLSYSAFIDFLLKISLAMQ